MGAFFPNLFTLSLLPAIHPSIYPSTYPTHYLLLRPSVRPFFPCVVDELLCTSLAIKFQNIGKSSRDHGIAVSPVYFAPYDALCGLPIISSGYRAREQKNQIQCTRDRMSEDREEREKNGGRGSIQRVPLDFGELLIPMPTN